ncbi:MAG: redoxin domain-containing protein [Solirubrobacterales bacterium]
MNRGIFSSSTLWVVLALASMALGETPTQKADVPLGRRTDSVPPATSNAVDQQPAAGPRLQYQRLQQRIDELKAAHQDLIAQLQALQKSAVKENAKETAGQIQTLIAKRQETFQNALRQLEQQQVELQQAGRDRMRRPGRDGLVRTRIKRAPDFTLDSFDGRTVKLSNYKDRIVVLEWMNPECPFTKYHYETAHTMLDLAKKYRDKEVVWLAINSNGGTTPEVNRDFAQKHKLPYPILDDRSGRVGRQYGARNTPQVVVIDKAGVIAYEGAVDNAPIEKQEPSTGSVNYVDKAISELLAGQKVTMPNTSPHGSTIKYAEQ